MTVPRIFATHAAGNVPASYLDEDFAACGVLTADNGWTGINSVIGDTNTGIVATDFSQLLVQSNATTAEDIYGPNSDPAIKYWGNLRSVMEVPAGTTDVNGSAIDFYVLNNCAFSTVAGRTVGAGVGQFGIIISHVDDALSWGSATYLSDSLDNTVNTGTGRGVQGHEYDFGIYSNGTTVTGQSFLLGGARQPVAATAIQVIADGTDTGSSDPIKWSESFVSRSGASPIALTVGALEASGSNVESQDVRFYGFDGSSNLFFSRLLMFNRSFFLSDATNVNGLIFDLSGTGIPPAIGAGGNGSDTDIDLRLYGKGAGGIRTDAYLSLYRSSAAPAGGTAGAGLRFSTDNSFGTFFGSGAPTLLASIGSQYLRTDGVPYVSAAPGIAAWFPVSATTVNTQTGASYGITINDTHVVLNHAGTVTVALPDATVYTNRRLVLRTITANTVVSAGSDVVPLIGGSAGTAILAGTAGKWAELVSDGAVWQIMSAN